MAECSRDTADLEPRLRAGDRDALAALLALHRPRLWRMAAFRLDARLRSRLAPDDVLQEAFVAAHQRIARYAADGFTSPFIWLRLILQQTLADVHRRHLGARMRDAARDVPLQGDAPLGQSTSASLAIQLTGHLTSPSRAAMRAEAFERVRAAIDTMDPVDREVLALRHFEELTNGEVADVLGIGAKAASIRYVRALRRLKAILSAEAADGSPADDAAESEAPDD